MENTNFTQSDEMVKSDTGFFNHLETTLTSSTTDHVTIEAIGGESMEAMPKHYYRSPEFIATFLSMALAYQGAFTFYVMVAGQTAIINADIGPSEEIVWVLLVFVLCQTIVFTLSGRFSDIFGRRWFFIGANVMAVTGYMIGGRADTVNNLIGGSVLAGLGSGVQQTMPVLMGELVPNKHRHAALAITFVLLGPMSSIGPGLGRTMATHASWRWVYYTAAIISGLSGLLQLFFYHPPKFHQLHSKLSRRKALAQIDYVGAILFAGSAASLLLGISWGGQKYPWHSGQVISTIVVGAVGFIVFILWEKFAPISDPLMPLFLFRNRNYICLAAVAAVGSLVFYALNIIWPSQVAIIYGESPDAAGWMTCTLVGGAVFGQVLGSGTKRYARFVSMKWQLVACCVIFTAFTGAMAKVEEAHLSRAIVFSIISSMMIGWMEIIALAGAPLMVEPEYIGVANGTSYTFRGLLSALAVSIYVTILNNQISTNSAHILAPALVKAGLPVASVPSYIADYLTGNAAALQAVPGFSPKILTITAGAAAEVFKKSFATLYLTSLAFGGVAILASLALDGDAFAARLTPEIARRLQNVKDEKEPKMIDA